MKRHVWIGVLLVLGLLVSGCSVSYRPAVAPEHAPGPGAKVPPGHMPPPGMCRIWFEGRPPGQQPPPGDCAELAPRVPPGAVLVHG